MKTGKDTVIWHPEKSVLLDCEIGDNCVIHAPVWIGNNVKIGKNCRIQPFAFIPEGVIIKDDVFIGPGVVFCNDKYPPGLKEDWKKTFVEKGAVIGANATILPGLIIGENSVIGAGSVATHNVLPNQTVAGNPAKPLAKPLPGA